MIDPFILKYLNYVGINASPDFRNLSTFRDGTVVRIYPGDLTQLHHANSTGMMNKLTVSLGLVVS